MKKLCLLLTVLYCLTMLGCGKPGDSKETSGNTTDTTGVVDSLENTGSGETGETTQGADANEETEATKATKPTGNSGNSAQTPKPTEHTCVFGDWKVKVKATCAKEGREERTCSK